MRSGDETTTHLACMKVNSSLSTYSFCVCCGKNVKQISKDRRWGRLGEVGEVGGGGGGPGLVLVWMVVPKYLWSLSSSLSHWTNNCDILKQLQEKLLDGRNLSG